jgi:hypothetical protein
MMKRFCLAMLCFAAGLLWSACAHAELTPAKPGQTAIIEIEITIEGKHSSKGDAGQSTEWRVLRNLKLSYPLEAKPLSISGISDPEHQQQQMDQANALGQQADQAAANNAGLMAQMQAAVEACGDDEACINAYVMKLSQDPQLQTMSKDASQMNQSMQAYNESNPPRYQQWQIKGNSPKPVSGEYKLDEWRKDVVYDPICYQTSNLCTTTRERKAAAKIDADDPTAVSSPMVEVDMIKSTISVVLNKPMFLPTIQQVTQDGPEQVQLQFLPNDPKEVDAALTYMALPLKGSYADQTGGQTVTLAQLDDYGAPLKMVLRWHFHVN